MVVNKNLIFIDTETTGFEIGKDRLCQISYKINDQKIITQYFRPPENLKMSVGAMSVNHITDKMLIDAEVFRDSSCYQQLLNLVSDQNNVIVGHNVKFDIAMLEAEGINVNNYICTLKLAKYLDKNQVIPSYALQYLRYYLSLDVEAFAHTSEGDVDVLYCLFNRIYQGIKKEIAIETEIKNEDDIINRMVAICSAPLLYKKFNFGKYQGKLIEEVSKIDNGYLVWLLGAKTFKDKNDIDWIYTLKYYLGLL